MSNLKKKDIKDLYLLSPMQEGMLYHSLLDDESFAYFEQVLLSVEGRLNVNHIEASFNKLIERYDILRTVFIYEKVDTPVQVVMKERRASIGFEDIAHLPEEATIAFIEDFKVKDRVKGFDLSKDIPIRVSIIKTSDDSYKFIWSFHHIIMDGWCLGIVMKEFLEIYTSLQEDRPAKLGNVHPYSDYIKWLGEQNTEKPAAYWERYLNDYEEQASLAKNNNIAGKYSLAEVSFRIDETNCLKELAGKNNVTLNTVVQTIWGILLQRYNNTDDVVFGTVVSGRPHEISGIENMVGLFINTLPVRIKCESKQSFAKLLSEVQQAAAQSEQYSYYPLAQIQAKTELKSDLIEHIMVFENYPVQEIIGSDNNPGFIIRDAELFEQTNYDFNIIVFPGKELSIRFSYNALVYDRSFVEKLAGHFKSIIKEVISNPGIPIKDIDILTEAEKQEILYNFNNTQAQYPKEKTIQELFEEQVTRTPYNSAVIFADKHLTYQELNNKANQLARVLRQKGVKANSIVGIMVERSLEMMIGLMGILKAGGAYLPIDPDYPEERIGYMLENSGATILLTQKHLVSKIALAGNIIDLDEVSLYYGDCSNQSLVNNSQDLAYVIYTSGSTGKPKGVMVEQHTVVNLLTWLQSHYPLGEDDVFLQKTSFTFDVSVWELLWGALVGASVCILKPGGEKDLTEIVKIIDNNKITAIDFVPSLLNVFLDYIEEQADLNNLSGLRKVFAAGEALKPSQVARFNKILNRQYNAELFNLYGPTETHAVSYFDCSTENELKIIPIGKPIANSKIYIVDKSNKLQPVGVAGELCITGDGLARGYLNSPELTTEKFIDNPFIPGERMYRTGDLARWLPDGNIEFLGRIDHQVKIRGFRIELGEIEAELLKHSAIKETVVIPKEDVNGDRYLCAYNVAEQELVPTELREHLLKTLPDYMIPSYFVQLEKMPLTPNGKIDRKALLETEDSRATRTEYIAPRNEAEARIQKVWQETLGNEMIGIEDNFFIIGGNSIKAIQVVAKLSLDFEIGVNDIFQYQTISKLADKIKYSKDRLKKTIAAFNEAAATKVTGISFDRELRSALKRYKIKNRTYEKIDLSERIDYKHILLAGSTGYLGIHILYQLLTNTDCIVYVPIRANNDMDARERLRTKLEFYFNLSRSEHENLAKRIYAFNGDLTKDYLGLCSDIYMDLADKIDCIINSAANVKHYGCYSEFYDINVKGNERLIEFANTGRKKAYNFISTIGIGSGYVEGKARTVFTEYDCNVEQNSDNYYVTTKLAAEKYLVKSRESGLNANVFRVGHLVFDSTSGVFQENIVDNALYTLLQSLIKIGYFPVITKRILNFSFIDYVAKAIILLFDKKNLQNETHHLLNSRLISMVSLAELLNQAGVSVNMMAVNDFSKYLLGNYENEAMENYITRILVYFYMVFEANKTSFIIRNQKTESVLQALNFQWSELDVSQVILMVKHCRKVGFI